VSIITGIGVVLRICKMSLHSPPLLSWCVVCVCVCVRSIPWLKDAHHHYHWHAGCCPFPFRVPLRSPTCNQAWVGSPGHDLASGGSGAKSTLPDAPGHALIPQDTQNEPPPAYTKLKKIITTTTAILHFFMHVLRGNCTSALAGRHSHRCANCRAVLVTR
jgi:hypothetical protein